MALTSVASLLALGLGVTSATAVEPKVVVQGRTNSSTTLDVSWTGVKGADAYRVRYSTDSRLKKSVKSLPDVDSGEEATIKGLEADHTYYVEVTALDDEGDAVGASTVVKATTAYPYPAPGDIYPTKVTGTSMVLSWKSVGDAPAYAVEVEEQTKKGKKTTTLVSGTSIALEDLKKETVYSVRVRAAGKDGEELSDDSPSQNFTTSAYELAAPDAFKQGKQGPTSFDVSWSAVDGLPKDAGYVVEWSLATSFTAASTSEPTDETKTTIGKLKGNQTYYARVHVVDADGKRASANSDYITAKTVVGRGTLAGDVSGAPSGDLMAVAYDKDGSPAAQAPVSGGGYELDVRPEGSPYKVQVLYVGPPAKDKDDDDHNYVSTFAHSKGSGWTISEGSTYTVERDKTTKVADVTVPHGNVVEGTVVNGSTKIRDVDVTAISGVGPGKPGQEREVIGTARSDASGHFLISGLPDGPYWFRYNYVGSGKGYSLLSQHLDVDSDLGLKVTLKKK